MDLGAGNDDLYVYGKPDGMFAGGAGVDLITLGLTSAGEHAWRLDAGAHLLTRDGEEVAAVSGFSTYAVRVVGTLAFVGSDASETFVMFGGRYWIPRQEEPSMYEWAVATTAFASTAGDQAVASTVAMALTRSRSWTALLSASTRRSSI